MRTVLFMWKHPSLIIMVAVSAALYATGLVVLRIPPPLNIRPVGQLLPMPLSLMFGPAGAWGTAIGDLLHGLVVGQIDFGTIFGFFGNFLLGYIPFALWSRLRPLSRGSRDVTLTSAREWILFIIVAISSASATAIAIAVPLHIAGVAPFRILCPLILVQDGFFGLASAVLLLLVYRRVSSLNMQWWQLLPDIDLDKPNQWASRLGAWTVVCSSLTTVILGLAMPTTLTIVGPCGIFILVIGCLLMW